jgi:spore cortex formation protein SpoVR/YcgB (stage V sporulation)
MVEKIKNEIKQKKLKIPIKNHTIQDVETNKTYVQTPEQNILFFRN